MNKLFVTLCFLFVSLQGQASSHQFFYQAGHGEHILTPQLQSGFYTLEIPNNNSSGSAIGGSISYEYGFLNALSAGATLEHNYEDNQNDNTDDYSAQGLGDIDFFIKGRQAISESWTLRYGANIQWSLEPNQLDSDSNEDNQFTGRDMVSPFLGIEKDFNDRHRGGLKVSHDILIGKEKTKLASGATFESEGGEVTRFHAFYEFHTGPWLAGGAMEYWSTQDYVSSGVRSEAVDVIGYSLFANYDVSESLALVPEIQAYTILDDEVNGTQIDTCLVYYLKFSARFTF